MAGTAKTLSKINNIREEISHIVDLLSRKRNMKVDIVQAIKEQPLYSMIFAVLTGFLAGILSNKIKSLFKLALLTYATKQSISRLIKK